MGIPILVRLHLYIETGPQVPASEKRCFIIFLFPEPASIHHPGVRPTVGPKQLHHPHPLPNRLLVTIVIEEGNNTWWMTSDSWTLSTSTTQNGCHLADNVFKLIFLNENCCIFIQISLTFVPKGPINNKSTLVQKTAWCRTGDTP